MTKVSSHYVEALKGRGLRHCLHCGLDKPDSDFGTAAYCRRCWADYMAKRRASAKRIAANREEIRKVKIDHPRVRRDLELRLREEGLTSMAARQVLSQFTPKALDMGVRLWPAVLARAREFEAER